MRSWHEYQDKGLNPHEKKFKWKSFVFTFSYASAKSATPVHTFGTHPKRKNGRRAFEYGASCVGMNRLEVPKLRRSKKVDRPSLQFRVAQAMLVSTLNKHT